jgi:integrase
VEVYRDALRPVLAVVGRIPLRDLTVQDVRTALARMAVTHSTATLQKAHNCLTRVLRHAEGRDLVRRNVSALVDTPRGREGRPSQALTLEQAAALLEAAEDSRLNAYIVLCLLTGVRSEEARALTWEHVDLDAATISVWRSVRAHGDTKTNRSRRTLRIPQIAIEALQEQLRRQAEERSKAGELWQEHGLVFTTTVGTPYESHNLRRDFRRVHRLPDRDLGRPAVPAHQLGGALDGVADVEQLPDQRLDPSQRPPLVTGELVRQRPFPQLGLQPGPLPRTQPLPRHRAPGPQRLVPAVLPGPAPPPHRPFSDPQVIRDLADRVAAGEPPGSLQPQPLTPLLLGGRIPAPLRIPHTPVIRPRPPDVTTLSSTSSVWLAQKYPVYG